MFVDLKEFGFKNKCAFFLIYSATVLSTNAAQISSGKYKRQLFRENLLPEYGGKIPEAAFKPERINLNLLNQNGLFSPDGFFLEQRNPLRYHEPKQFFPATIKINIEPNNENVALPGRQHVSNSVDTTYLIREPSIQVATAPPKLSYYYLPILPKSSLKLIRKHKANELENNYISYESSTVSSTLGAQILAEFVPLLKKLTEARYI